MANTEKYDVVYSCVDLERYFFHVYVGDRKKYYFTDETERVKKVIDQIKEGKKILFLSTTVNQPKYTLDKLVEKIIKTIADIDEFNDNASLQLYHDFHREFIRDHVYYKFLQNKKRLVEKINYVCENNVTEDTELYYCDNILDTLMKSEE